ncbi:hypothetical protein ACMZYS_21795, partial [Pseudomonas syringae pv. actinidiae]
MKMEVLRNIINEQLELLRLTLYVTTQGPLEYGGEMYTCSLSEEKVKTSQPIAMAAGQTVNTLLKCSDWRGIPVRDLYPLARSCIESFINASFLLVYRLKINFSHACVVIAARARCILFKISSPLA